MRKISVRLTDEQYEQLMREAEQLQLKISDIVRSKLNRKLHIKTIDRNLLYELNRIGNNLNQIARYVNAKRAVDLAVLQELKIIEDQLKELL